MIDVFELFKANEDPEVIAEVRRLFEQEIAEQCDETERLRQALGRENRRGHRAVNGLGGVTSNFTIFDYLTAEKRFGANPKRDPDLVPWMLKQDEFDYARVRSRGTKVQTGYTGERKVKFHKVYES